MPKYKAIQNKTRFRSITGTIKSNLNPAAPPFRISSLPRLQTNLTMATSNPPNEQSAALEATIRGIVQQIMTANSNNNTQLTDETITNNANLADLDKIPDLVKAVREFSGDRAEYTAWRKSVNRIFELYGSLRGTAKYFGIISVIRNKIIGNANIALESHNTPLNWDAIKQCLNSHYADRRDIGTLEYQLTTLVQGNNSIEQFYQEVYSHLSMMLNNISCMELEKITEAAFIDSYRNKALDTFIRGLNGDLPRLLAVREPKDLSEALNLCTKLANQSFRQQYANTKTYAPLQAQRRYAMNNFPNTFTQNPRPPTKQYINPQYRQPNDHFQNPRPYINFQNPNPRPYTNFQNPNPYTNLQNSNPISYNNLKNPIPQYQQNTNPPPRPTGPKPRNYEPMEVDHSINSRMVNYANRPQSQKPQQNNQHNYNINTYQTPEQDENNQSNNNINTYQMPEQDETFLAYAHQYERQCEMENNDHQYMDTTDVHFLE